MEAAFRSRTVKMLRTWGAALVDAHLEDGVVWAEVSQDDLRRIDADPSSADGLANLLSTVREAEVAVVFREVRPGVVDVSMRSTPRARRRRAPAGRRLPPGSLVTLGSRGGAGCLAPGDGRGNRRWGGTDERRLNRLRSVCHHQHEGMSAALARVSWLPKPIILRQQWE